MYHNQETIDVEDDLPITYLGYQVDSGWTHITGVYAVHMEGNKIEWYTDIVNLAYKIKFYIEIQLKILMFL